MQCFHAWLSSLLQVLQPPPWVASWSRGVQPLWYPRPNLGTMRRLAKVSCCLRAASFLELTHREYPWFSPVPPLSYPHTCPFSTAGTSISPWRQHLKKLLLTPVGRTVSNLTNHAMALNCWKEILHGSPLSLHILQMRHPLLSVPDHLFKDVYIVNSLGRQR